MQTIDRVLPVITSAEIEKDAHAVFRRYRATHPFAVLETGGYIVLRHEDVSILSRDPRLQATETAIPAQGGVTEGALFDVFDHGMLTANAQTHTRRRTPISRAVATQAIDRFRASVRVAAEALVEGHHARGRMDLAADFAAKLPVLALAAMLGVPDHEVPDFLRDVTQMNAFFRPAATQDDMAKAEVAAARFQAYLATLISRKWVGQADDFVAQFLAQAEADQPLSRAEVVIQLVQLVIGGTESVRTALVAQTANLLSHPVQWQAVCRDAALVPAAVTESLRYEPGIAGIVRVSTADIDRDGWTLPAGQLVILSSLSALRDERVFAQADRFDIFREERAASALAFGGGAHRCVADAFGRAELEVALSVLAERLPGLRLETRPVFLGHVFVRSTSACWVSW